jgi:hypothetical protein
MSTTVDANRQAVSGLVPPQECEATVREVWPSVTTFPTAANVGKMLIRSIILAPLGWAFLLPVYFLKILPFVARRYTLTNRRLMIQRGLRPRPSAEVALANIDVVRLADGSADPFYRSATLEILSQGKLVLSLPGVPDPELFRRAIENTCAAWVPGKAAILFKQ